MLGVTDLSPFDAFKLINMIYKTAHKAKVHRETCTDFASYLHVLSNLLYPIQNSERVLANPAVQDALAMLHRTLVKALLLIQKCEQTNTITAILKHVPRDLKDLEGEIQKILSLLNLANLHVSLNITTNGSSAELNKLERPVYPDVLGSGMFGASNSVHEPGEIAEGLPARSLSTPSTSGQGLATSHSISAKSLSITWGNDERYWRFVQRAGSRSKEVAYVSDVYWLEVRGQFNTGVLRPGLYTVTWRLQVACLDEDDEPSGWDSEPVVFKFSTSDGRHSTTRSAYLAGKASIDKSGHPMDREGSSRGGGGSLKGRGGSLKGRQSATKSRLGFLKGREGSSRGREGSTKGREGSVKGGESSTQSEESSAQGEESSVQGEESPLQSEGSSLQGKGSSLQSEGSSLEGKGSSLQGEGNSLQGKENSLHGEESSTLEKSSFPSGEVPDMEDQSEESENGKKPAASSLGWMELDVGTFTVDKKRGPLDLTLSMSEVEGSWKRGLFLDAVLITSCIDLEPEIVSEDPGPSSKGGSYDVLDLPETFTFSVHSHELKLMTDPYWYACGECEATTHGIGYHCLQCKYNVHPECCMSDYHFASLLDLTDNEPSHWAWDTLLELNRHRLEEKTARPKNVMFSEHPHLLKLTLNEFPALVCDAGSCDGHGWVFRGWDRYTYQCKECNFDLHPECRL